MSEFLSNDPRAAETGVGAMLRQARERSGQSLDDVGRQVRMQVRMLEALENEDWQRLGAPVFIRGQLRSYGRALKVDVEPYLEQLFAATGSRPTEQLVSHSHTPRYQWLLEGAARRTMYVVLTAALVIPVWAVWNNSKSTSQPAPQTTASLDAIPAAADRQQEAAPITASIAPITRPATPALQLRMNGDSWVQIVAPDGSTVEKGLIKAGEQRSYAAGQVGRMVIGNASEVEVQQAGSTVDTAPYRRSNVARFAVSSDGSLAPATD